MYYTFSNQPKPIMKNIAIIYHDADFDGKLSNEVCRFHLKRLHPDAVIHSYGWDYGRPLPTDEQRTHRITVEGGSANTTYQWEDYDAIYIVDLSVDELMARPELRDKIVWIDHHKSAIEKWDKPTFGRPENGGGPEYALAPFAGIRIDGVAACRLCWAWFNRGEQGYANTELSKRLFIDRLVDEPMLLCLAGEYDVWDHRDPDAKALQFGLRALTKGDFDTLVNYQFACVPADQVNQLYLDTVIAQGHAIKSYCDKQNDEYSAAYARTLQWEGLTFCALNIGQRGNSDLLRGGLKPEHQAGFAWRHTGDSVMVSLYHVPGHEHLDLSEIAKRHGGGGHRGACGFHVTLGKLAEILDGGSK